MNTTENTIKEPTPKKNTPISKNIKHIVFIAVIAIICFSSFCNYGLYRINAELFPLDNKLAGGTATKETTVTTAQIKADPIGSIINGNLKEKITVQIEDKINIRLENVVPFHDSLLLTSASSQRLGITTASLLYPQEVLHTFYSSSYVFMPSTQTVFSQLSTKNSKSTLAFNDTVDELTSLATSNQDTRWFFYIADLYSTSSSNPTLNLISNPQTYQDYLLSLKTNAPTNSVVIDGSYNNFNDFLTDH